MNYNLKCLLQHFVFLWHLFMLWVYVPVVWQALLSNINRRFFTLWCSFCCHLHLLFSFQSLFIFLQKECKHNATKVKLLFLFLFCWLDWNREACYDGRPKIIFWNKTNLLKICLRTKELLWRKLFITLTRKTDWQTARVDLHCTWVATFPTLKTFYCNPLACCCF